MDISAGSLLTKTQEELILLLIQLRRQNILTERTIDMCNAEMKSVLVSTRIIYEFRESFVPKGVAKSFDA